MRSIRCVVAAVLVLGISGCAVASQQGGAYQTGSGTNPYGTGASGTAAPYAAQQPSGSDYAPPSAGGAASPSYGGSQGGSYPSGPTTADPATQADGSSGTSDGYGTVQPDQSTTGSMDPSTTGGSTDPSTTDGSTPPPDPSAGCTDAYGCASGGSSPSDPGMGTIPGQ